MKKQISLIFLVLFVFHFKITVSSSVENQEEVISKNPFFNGNILHILYPFDLHNESQEESSDEDELKENPYCMNFVKELRNLPGHGRAINPFLPDYAPEDSALSYCVSFLKHSLKRKRRFLTNLPEDEKSAHDVRSETSPIYIEKEENGRSTLDFKNPFVEDSKNTDYKPVDVMPSSLETGDSMILSALLPKIDNIFLHFNETRNDEFQLDVKEHFLINTRTKRDLTKKEDEIVKENLNLFTPNGAIELPAIVINKPFLQNSDNNEDLIQSKLLNRK